MTESVVLRTPSSSSQGSLDWRERPCVCGHSRSDHRSIPPYHCQHGMATGLIDCECPHFGWLAREDPTDRIREAERLLSEAIESDEREGLGADWYRDAKTWLGQGPTVFPNQDLTDEQESELGERAKRDAYNEGRGV